MKRLCGASPYDPSIPLPGKHQEELQMGTQRLPAMATEASGPSRIALCPSVEERVHETWPCHAVGRYSAPRGRRSDTGHNLAAEVMPGGGWPPVSALKNRGAVQGPAGAEPLSGPRDRISADKVCTCGNHEAMCIKEFYSEHESNHRGWWGEDTCGN